MQYEINATDKKSQAQRWYNELNHELAQVSYVNLALFIDSCSTAKLYCKQELFSDANLLSPEDPSNLVSNGNSFQNSPYKTTLYNELNITGGQPLYLLRLGQMDVKGLLKTIGEDGLLKLVSAAFLT